MRQLKGDRPPCPKCGNTRILKAGKKDGRQRYRCVQCGYAFSTNTIKGKPGSIKAIALALHSYGVTFDAISRLLNVSLPNVCFWASEFGEKNFIKPGNARVMKIPLKKMLESLPKDEITPEKLTVFVVEDEKGEIAGMIQTGQMEHNIAILENSE